MRQMQRKYTPDALTDLHQLALDLQGLGKDGRAEHYIRDIMLSPPERFSLAIFDDANQNLSEAVYR